MDGSVAIEWNRQALKRIVAMLVEMAGLGEPAPATFQKRDKLAHVSDSPNSDLLRKPPLPLQGGEEGGPASSQPPLPLPRRSGERWSAKRDGVGVERPCDGPHPEVPAEGDARKTLPRLLWRAILSLLRPAESAARRLIIAAAKGLTVPAPTPREPKPQTMEPLLRRLGIAITMPRGLSAGAQWAKADGGGARRNLSLPLFDPPRRFANLSGHNRHVPAHAAPRIMVPGLTEPARLPPPPSPDDLVSANHLGRRIAALAAALDDLPGQARRFARWKASRDALSAQEGKHEAMRLPASPGRISPLRRGRPPGGRLSRYDPAAPLPPRTREIDEILAHAHALAVYALENPDTS